MAQMGQQSARFTALSAESLAEAEAFCEADPYTVNGVFERIEVHPFSQRKILPLNALGRFSNLDALSHPTPQCLAPEPSWILPLRTLANVTSML